MRKIVMSWVVKSVLVIAGGVAAVSVAAVQEDPRMQRSTREAPRALEPVMLGADQLIQSSQLRAYPLDQTLIARRDVASDGFGGMPVAFEPGASYSGSDAASALPAAAAREFGFELPRPGRVTATLATLALGLFFFLRRVV